MELILAQQTETRIDVMCDGQYSHSFDLQPLLLPKEQEETRLLHDALSYGQALYAALFAPGTLALQMLYRVPERIVLVASSDELDAIPWEYLASSDGLLIQKYPFVRALPAEQRLPTPLLDTPLHIVAVPSNPLASHLPALPIDAEWLMLKESIMALPFAVTLERTRPPTIQQLRNAVAGQQHRVVHFMGHGAQEADGAVLCFEKAHGELDLVGAQEFAQHLRDTTFLVTLNACISATPDTTLFGNLAAKLVRQKIPYALGMRLKIYDEDAHLFARTFYDDLARGTSIEEALLQARLMLARESHHPWVVGVPVLYTSLATPFPGFQRHDGTPVVFEHQPHLEVSALPRAEGTFHGRIEELKRLGVLLTGKIRPRVLTIHGAGGLGKTALAREAVERFAFAWPGGVWSVSLETLPDRPRLMADLARFLGLKPHEISDPLEVERQVQARLTGQRTLLVLDNAETLLEVVAQGDPNALQLSQFLQQLPSASVSLLVTSRAPLQWIGESIFKLDGIALKEATKLFEQCAQRKSDETDHATAEKLSEMLEGNPLSLRLMGCAFKEGTSPLNIFMQEYEEQLIQVRNKYEDLDDLQRSLFVCNEISMHRLDSEQRNLLRGLCIFHAPFLAETAVALFDPEAKETEEALSFIRDQLHQLWQHNLLAQKQITTRDKVVDFYYLLPTMHSYIEQHLPLIYPQEELYSRFGSAYAGVARFSFGELYHSSVAEALVQQTKADTERGITYVTGIEQAFYKIHWAGILHYLGVAQQSLLLLEEVLDEAQIYGQAVIVFALNTMAKICHTMGQSQRAMNQLEQVLPLYQAMGDLAGEATTFNNMGDIYRAINHQEQALNCYKQALPIYQQVGDRSGEAKVLNNMARVHQATMRHELALSHYEQAFSIYQAIGDAGGEAATLHNLGDICRITSHHEQALSYYAQALLCWGEAGNRREEAITLNNMAMVYDLREHPERVLSLLEQSLNITREVGNRATEADILNNIGEVYRAINQIERALRYFEQSLAITREIGDPVGEAITIHNLALAYDTSGQIEQALNLFEQSLSISREINDKAGEAKTLSHLAETYKDMGQMEQALSVYEQALSLMRELGNRTGEAETLKKIGELYYDSDKLQQAIVFFEQALSLMRELGNRTGEAEALNTTARAYRAIGQPERALNLYEQALPITRETGARAAEGTCLNGMAVAYQHIRQPEQALKFFEQALVIMREVGKRAAEANTLSNIAILLYEYFKRSQEAIASMEEAINVLKQAGLTKTAAGRSEEELRHFLQMMHDGESFFPLDETESPLSPEMREKYTQATIVAITIELQKQDEWRRIIENSLRNAQSRGPGWQTEVDFLAALLALIDQHKLILPSNHPYASIMQASIAAEMTTLNEVGLTYRTRGQLAQALSFYEQALPIYREMGDLAGGANNLNNIGEVHRAMGQPERALSLYEQALHIYREIGDITGEVITLRNMAGLFYVYLDRPQDAITTMENAIDTLKRMVYPQIAGRELKEELLHLLQMMYRGVHFLPENITVSIFPAKTLDELQMQATDSDTALLLYNMAGFYGRQKKYTKAEPLLKRAMAICEQLLGAEHPNTMSCLNNLANMYDKQGKYIEAESLYRRALEIKETYLGTDHLDTAISLNDLALLCQTQGKYAEAESLYRRALAIREIRLGVDHPDTAVSLSNLAYLYDAQGKYTEAEPLVKRALEIREQQLGVDHSDTAVSLNNLAMLYNRQGKYAEVESLLKRSLAVWDQPDKTNRLTAFSLSNLAEFYQEQGRYVEAEPLYQRALTILEELKGAGHPDTAVIFNNLAEFYKVQGKYEEAEPLLKRALAICEQQLGANHPSTALSLSNLGGLYYRQKKYEEAEPLLRRSLAIYEEQLGANHPETARLLNSLGGVYSSRKEYKEAEPLLKRSLAIYEEQLGDTHPEAARLLNNLAAFYHEQKKYSEAEPLYQRALAIWEHQLGATHPNVALVLNNLANFYEEQGRYEDGEPFYQRALEICDSVLGREHPTTKGIHANYASFVQRWSMS